MRKVIEVDHVWKQYRLGMLGMGAFMEDVRRSIARVRGKEDPALGSVQVNDREDTATSGYVWALQDINFSLRQGETLGIIGKNGAGKSTLLKILSQVSFPTRGSIRIKGRVASLLEVGTGFHPDLTGRDNIYLNGAVLGMSKSEINRKFEEIVEFSGVQKYIDTPVKRYSSGMKVRLGFAVAAHLEPEILVVDEVLAVGDAEFQAKCLGKMQDVAGSGRTILFVSHNLSAVRNLCSRGIVLQNGMMVYDGTSADAIGHYRNLAGRQDSEEAVRNFETIPGAPAQFTQAKLVNVAGEQTRHFEFTEPVRVSAQVKINEKRSDTLIGLFLEDASSNWVLISTNDDFGITLLEGKEPGTYTVTMEIPSHLLKPGVYSISLSVRGQMDNAYHKADNCLSFEVGDTKTFRGMKDRYRKLSVVAPEIAWKLDA